MYDNNNKGWESAIIKHFLYFRRKSILFEGRLGYVKDML